MFAWKAGPTAFSLPTYSALGKNCVVATPEWGRLAEGSGKGPQGFAQDAEP